MDVTTCRLDGPADFFSIGQFVSGPGWRHARRVIDTFELVFVRRGVLPMRVGERELTIGANQLALLPPGVEHAGLRAITEPLDFYWMHFRLPAGAGDMHVGDADDAVRLPQSGDSLILPHWCRAADPDRLAVMCGQLIDLYARFGPHANTYCDYFLTCLLLEVTAQTRVLVAGMTESAADRDGRGADAAGAAKRYVMGVDTGGGVGGFRPDGHTVRIGGANVAVEGHRPVGLGPMLSVRSWIMANAFDDITVAKVADRFHYSPSYLTTVYKRAFGIGVNDQIVECRVDRARELLSSTPSPVADIAREVGYDDPKYFMRVFKRRTGLTPGQYRDAFPTRLYNTV
ncbi:helix-turn-helix transcriptional regulator [Bifidobacterium sp. 82T10]|uniref:Helix-turn-helix transcriptional regulator n=1 Tax=Bifidobacterium miconis TaxID=2834435 RepID=A0ABS6WJL3_9BIFI|nr:AraC family transcriptional regulator [Bifidobacterium miconis]MBW3093411.1 helix-turn-helix transcriptional regulator [Bifidobacterium miconis]